MPAELIVGEKAPDFRLPSSSGGELSLSDLLGKKVVLYFYPKDDTTGCTLEAIEFNKLRGQFAERNAEVVGVSPDSLASHKKFQDKHALSLTLASDETQDMLRAYGVWGQKSMYGRTYMGVERTTVLINESGNIARVWTKVKAAGHAQEVLDSLDAP